VPLVITRRRLLFEWPACKSRENSVHIGYRVSAERIGLAAKARLSNDLYPKFDPNGQRLRAAYTHSYLQKGLP